MCKVRNGVPESHCTAWINVMLSPLSNIRPETHSEKVKSMKNISARILILTVYVFTQDHYRDNKLIMSVTCHIHKTTDGNVKAECESNFYASCQNK